MGNRIGNVTDLNLQSLVIRHHEIHGKQKSDDCEIASLPYLDSHGHWVVDLVFVTTEGARGQTIPIDLLIYGIVKAPDTGLDLSRNQSFWLETI